MSGGWISSEFGRRFHPILHYWRLHAGMDFAVGCGTPVHAAASGSIVSAGWGGGYGNRIVVSHGIERGVGLATTYNHLSRIVVHGGHVSRGQAHRLLGHDGRLDRLPPALRDLRERDAGQPPTLDLGRPPSGPPGRVDHRRGRRPTRRGVVRRRGEADRAQGWWRTTARRVTTTSSRTSTRRAWCWSAPR
ncbi:hypothetical protein GCM10025868_12080 [Angustibacter aerolatus]|uniref:M23ase beta-sheet core domain-containing protein n=1 Tax=Angustibacter aerolatus TaxID=1162965 RepID=A0ABQ6JCP7_9ACTN|nr:M23 family metallopeptidase [Angustibacter aerolatus]GMA85958.1 hypothetical protein GCM10025868_12080 [Angustibacter aerolatus]